MKDKEFKSVKRIVVMVATILIVINPNDNDLYNKIT